MDKVYMVLDGENYPIEVFKYLASANAFAECYNENYARTKYDKCRVVEKVLGDTGIMDYVERHKK